MEIEFFGGEVILDSEDIVGVKRLEIVLCIEEQCDLLQYTNLYNTKEA